MKKSLFNPNGYSKHKNENLSNIANALVSIADGELDKMTLENKEESIHLTVVAKGATEETAMGTTSRDDFRKTLKGNPGLLPYYISEYFGNKEVPRYLTKGEAAYAMTVDPELELMGIRNGKGGSIIMSHESISFTNNEAFDNYKNFLIPNGKKTPSIDKVLEKFANVEIESKNEDAQDYDSVLIAAAQKYYDEHVNQLDEARQHLEDAEKSVQLAGKYDDEEIEEDENSIIGDDELDEILNDDTPNKKVEDDDDFVVESLVHQLNTGDGDVEVDVNKELMHDVEDITKNNEEKTPVNYEEELLAGLNDEEIEEE